MTIKRYVSALTLLFSPSVFLIGGMGLILAGFYLRLLYLERMIFHVDEYISLLAALSTAQRGVPILPSGMFYDHGLLFSYIGALFVASVDFSEAIVRWVSVIFGTLLIPVMYAIVRRMVRSPAIAFWAAAVITFYPEAVRWGGRARMHSQAQFFYAFALLLLWVGLTKVSDHKASRARLIRLNRAHRYLAYVTFVAVLFSHFVLSLALPPLTIGSLLGAGWLRGQIRLQKVWRQVWSLEGLIIGCCLAFGSLAGNFILAQVSQAATVGADGNSSILDIGFSPDRFQRIIEFAEAPENMGLFGLAIFGLIAFLYKWRREKLTNEDDAGAFSLLLLLGIILETIFLLAGAWRNERYYFIILLPPLTIASAYGLKQLSRLLSAGLAPFWSKLDHSLEQRPPAALKNLWSLSEVLGSLAFIGLIFVMFPRTSDIFKETQRTYRYNEALQYVTAQRAANDTLMTVLPAAGALYARPVNFYATQQNPFLIPAPQPGLSQPNETAGQWVDRYSGAAHVNDVATLNAALSLPGRTWFVADDRRITRYDDHFLEQLALQMTLDRQFDNVQVLIERDESAEKQAEAENGQQVAAEIEQRAQVVLSEEVIFQGHTLSQAGPTIHLTFFWQLIAPAMDYKVFVHLRDANGHNVAQADFLPYNGEIGFQSWAQSRGTADLFRTGTALHLPPDLGSGVYRLYIGLYDPLSGQRVAVTNDRSGEHAIYLGEVQIP